MVQALADLPPALICDLIGVQPRTAERFAALAGENWSDYLAGRRPARTWASFRPNEARRRARTVSQRRVNGPQTPELDEDEEG
ncbi:hypothetical protein [Streptomyces tibetensis]|uniref:hypothetical protein n=1 Tax=Streptomyces tibetensis TaxID=2382123 RepID=UPI0033DC4EC1